ncbi:hypothetical protein Defa_06310 [Desulfovibrio sp. TH_2024_36128]|uniref:Major facilitator superfamily (MFS) profile domain-containing protein n=1 Tax=Desulfovibrio falkowii TaxID=3136602 RepID=A0ABQ0E5X9_9BACT
MLDFFKASPPRPVTKNTEEINRDYNYWRLHLMASIWLGYAVFYFTRNSYKSIMPAMLKDLDWQLSDVGILSTIFYIVYGSSRFLGGIISDKSNPRYFMGVGLIITGFINIAFGMSSSLPALALLWGLNAFFQGWGWPPVPRFSPHGTRATSGASGGPYVTPRTTWVAPLFPCWQAGWLSTMAGATA